MEQEPILAWHFCGPTLRDGRPIPPDGEWLVHEGAVKMCENGLHASERLIDALQYAPGATICRVAIEDVVERDVDKLVARRRKILWRVENADDLLRAFAREAALSVVDLWDCPATVREYLETGREDIRAAWEAAWDVAGDAACAAAWAAAGDAAGAAGDAWAAAGGAKYIELNALLEKRVMEARKP